jgi:transposase InsO family protein
VGKERVERIWRREGLKVPKRQKPRGRLWLNDGSCVRLRPEGPNHVWSYDFVSTFTHDGRTVRMLNLIDEYTRKCLAIHVRRRIGSRHVIEVLADAMIEHGIPEHIRSDNGPEFVATGLRSWLAATGAKTLYIEPGSPWGERILRKLQLEAARRVPQRGDLLHAEGSAGAGPALADLLQHREAALFAGIQTSSSRGLEGGTQHGAWRSGNRCALPTSPHPRLRRTY